MSGSEPTKPTRPVGHQVALAVSTLAALAGIAVACANSPRGGPVEAPGGAGAPAAPSASAPAAGPGPVTTSMPASGDAGGPSSFAASGQRSQVVPPDLGVVERMCALLTSCDKLPIPRSLVPDDFASCVKKMSDEMSAATAINFSLTLRECGLQSDSCAGLRSCALRGASPESCSGRGKQGFVGFCDDAGRALTCWHDQTLAVRDCPRGGEQCIVVGGEATCTLGPCGSVAEGEQATVLRRREPTSCTARRASSRASTARPSASSARSHPTARQGAPRAARRAPRGPSVATGRSPWAATTVTRCAWTAPRPVWPAIKARAAGYPSERASRPHPRPARATRATRPDAMRGTSSTAPPGARDRTRAKTWVSVGATPRGTEFAASRRAWLPRASRPWTGVRARDWSCGLPGRAHRLEPGREPARRAGECAPGPRWVARRRRPS